MRGKEVVREVVMSSNSMGDEESSVCASTCSEATGQPWVLLLGYHPPWSFQFLTSLELNT